MSAKRQARFVHVEDKTLELQKGSSARVNLYARDGAIGLLERTDRGEPLFTELKRLKTHRAKDKRGRFR